MDIDDLLHELVVAIDSEMKRLEEEYKKSHQYKSSKRYKKSDDEYLRILLTKRNTIVAIINYIRSGDIKALAEIDYRKE
jgi:hypothetical protein